MGRYLAAGALGANDRSLSRAGLLEQIHRLAHGEPVISAARRCMLVEAYLTDTGTDDRAGSLLGLLTSREGDVLTALIAGRTASQIAVSSHIAITTVRTHIANILGKLGVQSQLQAVSVARSAGWGVVDDSAGSAMRQSLAPDIGKPKLRVAR